ncbi:hypothetical protein E0H77_00605 [Acinetobacter sp. ANC 4633]|uniref:hypothetical protein n=1 Tax=Acinetobacter sp. ANC 4633 TaxID=2529845 RepID=UPI00103B3A24|nr:hypothetical protein [Acinetobacter sp. ANC 4633]TCB28679.1 hypothetical protein E0H77_00605 [Acinetobacter sp. ANC 4633]
MGLKNIFINLMNKLFQFWEKLPDETKQVIIQMIMEAYEKIVRAYYQAHQKNQNPDQQTKQNKA